MLHESTVIFPVAITAAAILLVSGIAMAEATLPNTELVGLSGKCMDVLGGGTEPATPVVLFTCHGGDNQKWTVPWRGFDGPLVDQAGQCLEPASGSIAVGTPLQTSPCTGGPNQRFIHRLDGLISGPGGRCVTPAGTSDLSPIVLDSCHGRADQRWRERSANRFTPTGPFTRTFYIHDLATSPVDPRRVLATTGRSIFVSVDGGETWARPQHDVTWTSKLAFHLRDPSVAYAFSLSELIRTRDGGRTWWPIGQPGSLSWLTVATDALFAGGYTGLWRSDDEGESWVQIADIRTTGALQDPRSEAVLYAVSSAGFFRSEDGGQTWRQTLEGDLTHLLADPFDPDVLWVGGAGLFRSSDGGRTWLPNAPGTLNEVKDLAISQRRAGHLLVVSDGGAHFTADDGASWARLDNACMHCVPSAVDFALEDRLLVTSTVLVPFLTIFFEEDDGTIFVSDDGGATLKERATGLSGPTGPIAVDPFDPDGALAVVRDSLYRTENGGLTWTRVLHAPAAQFVRIIFDPNSQGRVFTWFRPYCHKFGCPSAPRAILASRDGGTSWEVVFGGYKPPQPGISSIAVGKLQGQSTLVARLGSQSLLMHTDAGDRIIPLPAEVVGYALAIDNALGILYLGGDTAPVSYSKDSGVTWKTVTGISGNPTVDPSRPGTVYALGREFARSDDGGESWTVLPTVHDERAILAVSSTGEVYRTASSSHDALFMSNDRGRSWIRCTRGLAPNRVIRALAPGPAGDLWLGQWETGFLRGRISQPLFLELSEGRFTVEVEWRDFQGRTGSANPRVLTSDSGYFWFFDDANVEAVVKILDGTELNDHFWVFYASLSNLELTVTVRDEWTGESRIYPNPLGEFASFSDLEALPSRGLADTGAQSLTEPELQPVPIDGPVARSQLTLGERFEVSIVWRDFLGQTGQGHAIPITDAAGAFWFFDPDNVEAAVKVLDARGVNGHWWVFYGSMTNVQFTLQVRDLATGQVRRYENPLGVFASAGDTEAFP